MDLNRLPSRYASSFRERLRKALVKNCIVIDVHSFPGSETWGLETSQRAIFLYDGSAKNSKLVQNIVASTSYAVLEGVSNDRFKMKCTN